MQVQAVIYAMWLILNYTLSPITAMTWGHNDRKTICRYRSLFTHCMGDEKDCQTSITLTAGNKAINK